MTDRPPFERIPGQRTHGPRWSETTLAEVVAVGTGANNGQVRIRLSTYDGAAGQDAELWARVAVPVAGKDRGAFLVPSKGDEVLVAFIGGDSLEARVRRLLEPARPAGPACAGLTAGALATLVVAVVVWGLPAVYAAAEALVRLGR